MFCPAHRRIRGRRSGPARPAATARWRSPRPAYKYCPGRHQTAGPAADDGGRVGHRYGGHELTGIGVLRVFKHRAARAYFDNATAIHHRHAVADALHHRHIMGNKQKRDAHLALQVEHQIDNLRPNGDIQGRHRLVGYHHLRIQRQRAGNADPLPLAAGKAWG